MQEIVLEIICSVEEMTLTIGLKYPKDILEYDEVKKHACNMLRDRGFTILDIKGYFYRNSQLKCIL